MNIQLANVLSDVSGMTGQAIIKAILKGERDPHKLAGFRHPRVKASEEQIAQSLEGNWQPDLLFVLKQEQDGCEFCHQQMAECHRQLNHYLQQREDRSQAVPLLVEKRQQRLKKKKGNKPLFDFREGLFRTTGTDLTQLDCGDVMTAATIISDAGWDMSKWETENHFVSWLRRCPDNRISGEKIIGKGRLPTNNRVTTAFKDRGQQPTRKQYLSVSAVPPIKNQAGCSLRDQGDVGQAGPLGLPHSALRDEICGSRSQLYEAQHRQLQIKLL